MNDRTMCSVGVEMGWAQEWVLVSAEKGWGSGIKISGEVAEKSDSVIPDLTVSFHSEAALNHADF